MGLGRGAWNHGVIVMVVSIFFSMISNITPIYHIPNIIGLWDSGSTVRTHLSSLGL